LSEALATIRRTGERSTVAAKALGDVGALRHKQGREKEAEAFLIEALELRRALTNGDSPQLVAAIESLATFYFDQKRTKEWAKLTDEARKMRVGSGKRRAGSGAVGR
jgi:hypothetical protein